MTMKFKPNGFSVATVFLLGAVLSLVGFVQGATAQSVAAPHLEEVTLHLKWMHAFQFAGYYAAKEQGYYLVQTYWERQQAFWVWTQSEAFLKAHSNRPPAEMFAGANVLEIHEIALSTERKAE